MFSGLGTGVGSALASNGSTGSIAPSSQSPTKDSHDPEAAARKRKSSGDEENKDSESGDGKSLGAKKKSRVHHHQLVSAVYQSLRTTNLSVVITTITTIIIKPKIHLLRQNLVHSLLLNHFIHIITITTIIMLYQEQQSHPQAYQ
jgi:hypothetical protein